MGFRFRKKIKLCKLISLNVGKTGVTSMSVGKPGLTFNINDKGIKTTVGLPGTGLSYSTSRKTGNNTSTNNNTRDYSNYTEATIKYKDKEAVNESTRKYVMWWFLAIPLVVFFAAVNREMADIAGIVLLGSLGFIFIRQQRHNFNIWAHEQNQKEEHIRRARMNAYSIWNNLTAQDIVECVNIKYGTCFIENNLVSSSVDEGDFSRYIVTLFAGGQTIKTSSGFVRNRNVTLHLNLGDVKLS